MDHMTPSGPRQKALAGLPRKDACGLCMDLGSPGSGVQMDHRDAKEV